MTTTTAADRAGDLDAPANPNRSPAARLKGSSAYRWYWVAALAIVALTVFLRLWRLDLVQFRDDQAALLRMAEDMVRLGRIPLAGMTSSVGIPLAPSFEYLLAPIVAVSRDPRVATGAIGLANAAGVVGTLILGWRWFSPLTGVVAGLVYAANPWAVFYARKVWSNDVLAPLAVLLMFCLDSAIVGGQVGWGVAAFPLFALGVEWHPSFGLLAPLMVVLGAVLIRRGHRKHVALGLGLGAVTTLPYLIYTFQTQGSYLRAGPAGGGWPPQIDGAGPGDVIGLIGGWRNWIVEGLDSNRLLPWRLAAVPGTIETLLLAIGIAAGLMLVLRSRQVEDRLRAAGLLLWVLLPMLLTVVHPIPLYDYYFLFVLPAGALLIGLGIQMLGDVSRSRRGGPVLVGSALAAVVVVASIQSVLVVRQLGYLTDGYVVTYGPPLAAAEQTTRELLDLVNGSGGRELSIEIDDVNDAAIGYLARPYVPEVQVAPRRRGPWDVDFDLPNQSGSPPYVVTGAPQLSPPAPLDVSYADGVRALSASTTRVATPGESVGLALTWTLDQHSPQPLTNRLVWEMSVYDPSGHEIRRIAGLPHDWAELADGEVVVSWITVATPPEAAAGIYQVHVDRLDPVTRQPVPASSTDAEFSSGTVELRKN
ncbi:MAG: hypothetical protein JOZ87_00590 [Chloroflexi bacterium]|nr:hypothetical protein [Chloroflexota bacterium]